MVKSKDGPTPDDFEAALVGSLEQWESFRLDGLRSRYVFENSRANAHSLNAERLERKYGPDHPMALEAAARAKFSLRVAAGLRDQVKAADTTPTKNKWTVYGIVKDKKGAPVGKRHVTLFDLDGNALREHETTSDPKGVFVLEVADISDLPGTVTAGTTKSEMSTENLRPRSGERSFAEIVVNRDAGGVKTKSPKQKRPQTSKAGTKTPAKKTNDSSSDKTEKETTRPGDKNKSL